MLLRFSFAPLAVVLVTACSGRIALEKSGGDGGHETQDGGLPTSEAGARDAARGSDAGHDAAQGRDAAPRHDGGLGAPTSHRPAHTSCASTRPPGLQDGGPSPCPGLSGACTSDSQCPATNDAGGTNGRCTPFEQEGPMNGCPSCEYDQCATDSQCGTDSVCECGGEAQTGRYPNVCLSGNCEVDTDCGSDGYCSPNIDPCTRATLGYDCHTAHDACDNDIDCQNTPTGGRCVYDTSMNLWDCWNPSCPQG